MSDTALVLWMRVKLVYRRLFVTTENEYLLNNPKVAIARAKREIQEENLKKGVDRLKVKYRELAAAEGVVANINREIADLEMAIEHGN